MEKALEKHLDETLRIPGVSGVMCSNKQGLCLGVPLTCTLTADLLLMSGSVVSTLNVQLGLLAKGIANQDSSGLIASLAQQGAQLHGDTGINPVICLESDAGSMLIKSQDDVVMTVYKSSPSS